MSSRYLSYAVAIGIKLFMLYLIIGIGNSLAGQWGVLLSSPEATLNPRIYFQILGGAVAYMMLAWYIPSLASSLYTGAVALSAAELAYTGRSVMTAGAAASAAALASGTTALEGSRAVIEAAKFGRDAAIERGGGWASAATGSLSGAGLLVREGMRAAVPTLTPRGNSVANRIAERRALERPTVAGYTVARPSARSKPPEPSVSNDSSGRVQ